MADYSGATAECDIIMKGGVTSGVVYPKTILRLAEKNRFRAIGGTSAGAIAAVMTAAAEYNRAGGGFSAIEGLPEELERKLLSLFQPSPKFKPLFDAAMDMAGGRWLGGAARLLAANFQLWALPAAVGVALSLLLLLFGEKLAALLLFVILLVASVAYAVVKIVSRTLRELETTDFGMCPGPTQHYGNDRENDKPGLSDWLAEKIEVAAGRMQPGGAKPDRPLIFGDIAPAIDLRMMTTNLSVRRPHTLPALDNNHYFREDEFRCIFPAWVVDYLVKAASAITHTNDIRFMESQGLLPLPTHERMPLVVAARMSLSFPILFTIVPLYRINHQDPQKSGELTKDDIERMLFSDGGLSSNFPIHFFDSLLPQRPTFGVALDSWSQREATRRVHLPMKPKEGVGLDSTAITSLGGFLMGLVNAAKDWQDRLQSTLPGYRERIVSVYLTGDEGGLNLDMKPDVIKKLVDYGDRAGALATGVSLDPAVDEEPFDFDEHRWRRFLVAFAAAENILVEAEKSWRASTRGFVEGYKDLDHSYRGLDKPDAKAWRNGVVERFDGLMNHVSGWQGKKLSEAPAATIPRPKTHVKLSPEY